MGSGVFSKVALCSYSEDLGRTYDSHTGRVSGQSFTKTRLDESLDPKKFKVRECVNSDEHPNTIPVILALDVTGSMGSACKETAETLGIIVTNLYEKFKDIEFCIMGIGDLAYDDAPIQMSQFESDIRIVEAIDKIYREGGGGGNAYESYTAAWYMGLYKTKLDCFDKQGRKGIIITMGDEPLNPYLPKNTLNESTNTKNQSNIDTNDLYKAASEKFDIYHIAVNHHDTAYSFYKGEIKKTFGKLLGDKFKVSDLQSLPMTIEECITESISENVNAETSNTQVLNENNEIAW